MPFGSTETYDETYDEFLEGPSGFDEGFDESFDDRSEFLPSLPQMLGLGGQTVGNVVSGLGKGISNLFNYRPNAPVRPGTLPQPGGVSSATLNTPQGAATIRLPSAVVPRDEFLQFREATQKNFEQVAGRVNTVQREIGTLASRTGTLARNVEQLRTQAARDVAGLTKIQRETNVRLRRLRRETDERINMMMMMSVMLGSKDQASGRDDDMLMMLPFMMMGSSSSDKDGGNNNMMMMAMAIMMMDR